MYTEDDPMGMQLQMYAQKDVLQQLNERNTHSMRLKAPYTILARVDPNDDEPKYEWLAYSIGRPRNVVWGIIHDDTLEIEYGCEWMSLVDLNHLLDRHWDAGFKTVATLANDRINSTIVGMNMYNHLKMGDDFTMTSSDGNRITFSNDDIMNYIRQRAEEEGTDPSTHATVYCEELAASHLTPNIIQDLRKNRDIPDYVIGLINRLLEYNEVLANRNLGERCPSMEQCRENRDTKACKIYLDGLELMGYGLQ